MIPEHIALFLRTAIKSVWALDLLVLMKNGLRPELDGRQPQ